MCCYSPSRPAEQRDLAENLPLEIHQGGSRRTQITHCALDGVQGLGPASTVYTFRVDGISRWTDRNTYVLCFSASPENHTRTGTPASPQTILISEGLRRSSYETVKSHQAGPHTVSGTFHEPVGW